MKEIKTGEAKIHLFDHTGGRSRFGEQLRQTTMRTVRRALLRRPRETQERGEFLEEGFVSSWVQAQQDIRSRDMMVHMDREGWTDYNSPLQIYEYAFAGVLNGRSITEVVARRKGALVVDLMAPSGTLVDLFTQLPEDPQRRGITVAYNDKRSKEEKDRDAELGIIQLTGDLTRSKTWRSINAALAGREADLIMERGCGALNYIPQHPQYYRYVTEQLWHHLSPNNGTLLLELPTRYITDDTNALLTRKIWISRLIQWEKAVKAAGIDVAIAHSFDALRLVKRPDSPAELPRV